MRHMREYLANAILELQRHQRVGDFTAHVAALLLHRLDGLGQAIGHRLKTCHHPADDLLRAGNRRAVRAVLVLTFPKSRLHGSIQHFGLFGDLLAGLRRARRKLAHVAHDHRKRRAGLARARGFNRGIQGEDARLHHNAAHFGCVFPEAGRLHADVAHHIVLAVLKLTQRINQPVEIGTAARDGAQYTIASVGHTRIHQITGFEYFFELFGDAGEGARDFSDRRVRRTTRRIHLTLPHRQRLCAQIPHIANGRSSGLRRGIHRRGMRARQQTPNPNGGGQQHHAAHHTGNTGPGQHYQQQKC